MSHWVHVKAAPGQGLEEQHLLRWNGKPVCALKTSGDGWRASLLNLSGVSARPIEFSNEPLDMTKIRCEQELMLMGWSRPETPHPAPFNKSVHGRWRRSQRGFVREMKSRGIPDVQP